MMNAFPKTTTRALPSYRPLKASQTPARTAKKVGKLVLKAKARPITSKKPAKNGDKVSDFDFVGIAG